MGTNSSENGLRQTALLIGKAAKIIGVMLLVLFTAPAYAQTAAPPTPPTPPLPPGITIPPGGFPPPANPPPVAPPPPAPAVPTLDAVPPASGGTLWGTNWGGGAFSSAAAACGSVITVSGHPAYVPFTYVGTSQNLSVPTALDCMFFYNPGNGTPGWNTFVGTALSYSNAVCPAPSFSPSVPYTYNLLSGMCERMVVQTQQGQSCPTHASGTPCACDAGYVFNSTKTACVTLRLSVNPSPPIIADASRVQNKQVLTQSDFALNLQKGNEPASGITVTLQAFRTAGAGAGQDTINGSTPTDAKGNTTATISTRDQPGTAVVMASDTVNIQTISPGVVHWFPADYQSGFSISCYTLSQEIEFKRTPINKNVCGLKGKSYHQGFLDDVSVQGSGIGLDGKIIQYHNTINGVDCFVPSPCAMTKSNRCAEVGTTIAVDPTIIPLGDSKHPGSHVNIDIKGQRYAQDTGGDIKKYKIDDYVGLTKTRHECMVIGRHQSKVTFLNY